MEIQVCTSKSDCKADLVQNCCFMIMALEMANSNPSSQVKERYNLAGDIKLTHHFPNTHHPQAYDKFSILKDNAECFHQ
jgi:hypothetical protein